MVTNFKKRINSAAAFKNISTTPIKKKNLSGTQFPNLDWCFWEAVQLKERVLTYDASFSQFFL